MPVTLRDIASKLSLSPSVVSGILNNRPGTWASAETRERILRTASDLGYQPNAAARALRNGKSYSVTFAYVRPTDHSKRHGYSVVMETLAELLGPCGYELKIKVLPDQEGILRDLAQLAAARTSDAVLLWGDEKDVEEQGAVLERHEMPFVVKGHHEDKHPEWLQFEFDHRRMAQVAVDHLVSRNHRKIAYIGYDNGLAYAEYLLEGYRKTMQELTGAAPREDFVALGPSDIQSVENTMLRWLHQPVDDRPTGLVIGSGLAAWRGTEAALARFGRAIGDDPNDFCVAGSMFENHPLMFGQGHAFTNVNFEHLTERMFESLLFPLLSKQTIDHAQVHVCPDLRPTEWLGNTDYVQFRMYSRLNAGLAEVPSADYVSLD